MANPARGEVAFKVADSEYTLKFSTNAICEAEELLDKGLNDILRDLKRVSTVRALMCAGLREKHPDITTKAVGAIMDKIGVASAVEHVLAGMNAAAPPRSESPNG